MGIPLALEQRWLSHTIGGVSGEAKGTGAWLGPGSEQDLVAWGGLAPLGLSKPLPAQHHSGLYPMDHIKGNL